MGVLLALAAALSYGFSDFFGGLASRRTSAWPVAFVGSLTSLLGAAGLALLTGGDPTRADLAWGALGGVGSGLGGAFLYRGLAAGRMGVVAPVSAVGAALLPVVVGLATGERPALLVWVGIVAAVPGIWLVSREPGDGGSLAAGILDGVLAGLGFGMLFSSLAQVPDSAGLWPVAVAQALSTATVALIATALGARWLPRARSEVVGGAAAGVLSALAVVAFLHATQSGLLTIAAVVTSLYPAVTILLAALVLKERIHRAQALGLACCGIAVALVAAG